MPRKSTSTKAPASPSWGGARQGAGRKEKPAKETKVVLSARVLPAALKQIEGDAASSELSLGDYLTKKLAPKHYKPKAKP